MADRIRPVCLPLDEPIRSQKFEDANPFVVGWGILHANAEKQSTVLQQIQVPIVSNKYCKMMYKRIHYLKANIQFSDVAICAGIHAGQSSCNGDSGGPLMLPIHQNGTFPFYQLGIVSTCRHQMI